MTHADVPYVVDYWCRAAPADLERMSVDASRLPPPQVLRVQLERLIGIPDSLTRSFYMMWLVDGKPVGYTALKNIVHGERAEMHLHMWDAKRRGKGYGATLFCKSALDFFDRFGLRTIVCEPSASNPLPNAMLRRVGFPLVGVRLGTSSELSQVCKLNTYAIDPQIAKRHLASIRVRA